MGRRRRFAALGSGAHFLQLWLWPPRQPGVVLAAVGLPGYLLLGMASRTLRRVTAVPRLSRTPIAWLLDQLDSQVLQIIYPSLDMMAEVYRLVTIAGLGLVAVALMGSFLWRMARR